MRPDRWDALSAKDREVLIKRLDPSMREKRWEGLVKDMSNSRFDELTELQKNVVREMKG